MQAGIPRYYSIWRILWSRITSGHYPAGSLLGTESGLAGEFGVSRVTLREALGKLESEGLVTRRPSLGTFVADDVVPRGVTEFTSYLDDIVLQADSAVTTYFEMQEVAAPASVALALGTGTAKVVRLRRLRCAEDAPRLWIVDYLPLEVAAKVSQERLRSSESLLSLLDQEPGNRLSWGQQNFSVRTGDAEVCERLQLPTSSPVLYSDRVVYTGRSSPIGYAEMYYPPTFSLAIRLGRIT